MSFSVHCCVGLLLGCLISCGSSRKDSAKAEKIDSTRQTSKSPQDTMPDVPIAKPAPAPGTVELRGEVLSKYINNDGRFAPHIKMKVLKIIGYGAATPSLAPNDTLQVMISKSDTVLQAGVSFDGTMQVRQVMSQFEEKSPAWKLLKFSIKN